MPLSIEERKAKVKLYNSRYYAKNPDRGRDRSEEKRAYYEQRGGKEKKSARVKANAPAINAAQAKRRARQLMACPKWANLEQIARIYQQAKIDGLEVDHIIPLQGRMVCGLHVENNLQLLTAAENQRKGNKFAVL